MDANNPAIQELLRLQNPTPVEPLPVADVAQPVAPPVAPAPPVGPVNPQIPTIGARAVQGKGSGNPVAGVGGLVGGVAGSIKGGPIGGAIGSEIGQFTEKVFGPEAIILGAGPDIAADLMGVDLNFGSGKDDGQRKRDAARNVLADVGLSQFENGEHFVTINGNKVSIGQDGASTFKGSDGQTDVKSAFEIDPTHPLKDEATALIDPLAYAIFGDQEAPRTGMVIQMTNALLRSVGPDATIEDLRKAAGDLYSQSGADGEIFSNTMKALAQSGTIDNETANVFINNLRTIPGIGSTVGSSGPQGQAQAGNIPQGAQQIQGSALWKPTSESDGNLVMLFPYQAGEVVIKDAKTGEVLDTGRSTGPSNGYADTVRFSKPGGAFQNVIVEDQFGNQIPIQDGSKRVENIQVKGFGVPVEGGLAGSLGGVIDSGTPPGIGGGSKGKTIKIRQARMDKLKAPESKSPDVVPKRSVKEFADKIRKQKAQK